MMQMWKVVEKWLFDRSSYLNFVIVAVSMASRI
jgi:hypothetical protein